MNSRGRIFMLLFIGAALCLLGLLARQRLAPLLSPVGPDAVAHRPGPSPSAAIVTSSSAKPPSTPPTPSPEGENYGIRLTRRCLALAQSDPLAAMEMALAHGLSSVDPGLLSSLMTQWAKEDFEGAYGWTKKQEPGAWRDDALARLAYQRAQADPSGGARLVVTDIPVGPIRDEAIVSVVHQWALRDTEAATLWAESFTDQTLRQRALAEVAGIAPKHAQTSLNSP